MGELTEDILEAVKKEIENSPDKVIQINKFAEKHKVCQKILHYKFILKYGISIKDYHDKLKFELLEILIRQKNGKYSRTSFDIATSLGFRTDSGLQNFLKRTKGITFTKYLRSVNNNQ